MKRRVLTVLATVLPLVTASATAAGQFNCESSEEVTDPEHLQACFDFQPKRPGEGRLVFFDASSSKGSPDSYHWEFGQLGEESQGPRVSQSFPYSGTYDVMLTVGKRSNKCVFHFCTASTTRTIEVLDELPSCKPTLESACLAGQRFRIEAQWWTRDGDSGVANALRLTDDTGYFWFFDKDSVDLVVKVVDGRDINGNHWVLYGALTNVGFELKVTDTENGNSKTYRKQPGQLVSIRDVEALTGASSEDRAHRSMWILDPDSRGSSGVSPGRELARSSVLCESSKTRLCIDDRFAVEVAFEDHDGNEGLAQAEPLTEEAGYFWFSDDGVEIVVKILDARNVNGHFSVFFGSLTDVEFDLTVTDLVTGHRKTYHNEEGDLVSQGDVQALPMN